MSRNNVRDKKNLIITIIVIVLIAAVAAGLFLFLHYMILEVPIVQGQTKHRR